MNKLKDKKVVIAGGIESSIVRATIKLFLNHGAKVMLIDSNVDALKIVSNEIGNSSVSYYAADVTKLEDVKRYIQNVQKLFGKIDVFFNNAGIEGVVKPVTEYPEDVFDSVMAMNVRGVWLGNKYMIPFMNDGGSIIMSSSAGLGAPNVCAYVISKYAVLGIMKNLTLELAPRKIRVNTINPSPVDNRKTRIIESRKFNHNGFAVHEGKYAKPEEIANLVLFLACDDSKYISGTTQTSTLNVYNQHVNNELRKPY